MSELVGEELRHRQVTTLPRLVRVSFLASFAPVQERCWLRAASCCCTLKTELRAAGVVAAAFEQARTPLEAT